MNYWLFFSISLAIAIIASAISDTFGAGWFCGFVVGLFYAHFVSPPAGIER